MRLSWQRACCLVPAERLEPRSQVRPYGSPDGTDSKLTVVPAACPMTGRRRCRKGSSGDGHSQTGTAERRNLCDQKVLTPPCTAEKYSNEHDPGRRRPPGGESPAQVIRRGPSAGCLQAGAPPVPASHTGSPTTRRDPGRVTRSEHRAETHRGVTPAAMRTHGHESAHGDRKLRLPLACPPQGRPRPWAASQGDSGAGDEQGRPEHSCTRPPQHRFRAGRASEGTARPVVPACPLAMAPKGGQGYSRAASPQVTGFPARSARFPELTVRTGRGRRGPACAHLAGLTPRHFSC